MRLNKKAESESSSAPGLIATIIVVLVILFTISAFVFNYLDKVKRSGEIEACKIDVLKAFGSKILGKGQPLTDLPNCKRGQEKIFKDESNTEINSYLAKTLDDCMHAFSYGGLDWRGSPWIGLNAGEIGCFYCNGGIIKFEEPSRSKYLHSNSLFNYIKTFKLKNGIYLGPFMEESNTKARQNLGEFYINLNSETGFNTHKTYVVFISRSNQPIVNTLMSPEEGTSTDLPFDWKLGTNIKKSIIMASINILPMEAIGSYCDIPMN
jgi:hypothetical protein